MRSSSLDAAGASAHHCGTETRQSGRQHPDEEQTGERRQLEGTVNPLMTRHLRMLRPASLHSTQTPVSDILTRLTPPKCTTGYAPSTEGTTFCTNYPIDVAGHGGACTVTANQHRHDLSAAFSRTNLRLPCLRRALDYIISWILTGREGKAWRWLVKTDWGKCSITLWRRKTSGCICSVTQPDSIKLEEVNARLPLDCYKIKARGKFRRIAPTRVGKFNEAVYHWLRCDMSNVSMLSQCFKFCALLRRLKRNSSLRMAIWSRK